jgi:hypothetical protein
LGELSNRIKLNCVKPPVPSIAGLTWPTADEHSEFLEVHYDHHLSHSQALHKLSRELI